MAHELLGLIQSHLRDEGVLEKCLEHRKRRLYILNQCVENTVGHTTPTCIINIYLWLQIPIVTEIADSPETHWRYSIIAIRFLRSLMRKDAPLPKNLVKFFLRSTHDTHPSMVSGSRSFRYTLHTNCFLALRQCLVCSSFSFS